MPEPIQIHLRQIGASTSEAIIRDHTVLVDRPAAKGGSNAGPMGGELFLASVAGCFMSNLLAAANARETGISDVRIEVTGTLAGAPPRFDALELYITSANVDRASLQHLVDIADRGCIMMNTLRGKLDVQIRIGVPA